MVGGLGRAGQGLDGGQVGKGEVGRYGGRSLLDRHLRGDTGANYRANVVVVRLVT